MTDGEDVFDFAAWKRAQFEQASRLRLDIDKKRRRLEKLGVLVEVRQQENVSSAAEANRTGVNAPHKEHDAAEFGAAENQAGFAHASPVRRLAALNDESGAGDGTGNARSGQSLEPVSNIADFAQVGAGLESSRQHAIEVAHQEPHSLTLAVEVSCVLLCGGFARQHIIRRLCFRLFKSMTWRLLHALSILVNTISIAYGADNTEDFDLENFEMPRSLWIDFVCSSLLFLEITVGCIAIGFVGAHSTWLSCSGYHKLDFAVLITSAANLGISFVFGSRESMVLFTLRPLRLIQLLKVLSCLRHFVYVKHIVKAARQGSPLIGTVLGLLTFVVLFFAALALSVFQHKPYGMIGRCIAVQRLEPPCASSFGSNWTRPTRCSSKPETKATEHMVASEEDMIGPGFPFYQTCDPEKAAETAAAAAAAPARGSDALGAIPCIASDLVQMGQIVGKRECRYVARNMTRLKGKEEVSASLLSSKFAHFNHILSACMAVLQTVFADAAYDVLNDAYYSNYDARAVTLLILTGMTITVQFLVQGLFVAGKK